MVGEGNVVSGQIEEILQLSRLETERQIAQYRVFLFSVGIVLSASVLLLTEERSGAATLYWMSCLGYAVVFQALLKRYGATTPMVLIGLLVDLSACAGMFLVAQHFSTTAASDPVESARWPTYVLPATLYVFLLINFLRASRVLAMVGAVWAAVLFVGITVWFDGWRVQQAITGAIFVATGPVGYVAAEQARRMLDRFARFQLLRRYLPTAAVERVLTENPDQALALGGDLLTVTILAADLRGFTAMSERMPPGEVVRQLNAYHGAMLEVIDRHGGMLDKFIGDGTLVVFGLERVIPVKLKDSGARAALECARDMLVALDKLNAGRALVGLSAFRMGIGIHTGPVVAGNIGAPGRRIEFTVVGDTVNIASRLEGITKECGYSVVLSAATAVLLASLEGLHALDVVRVKGRDQALSLYALGPERVADSARSTPAQSPPVQLKS